ncbi:hypothetical protein PINS_up007768 [Pythium insidiosum]|nr:hypothetical protein PINS_up007768 [Pythium insidiosum]
MEWRAIAWLGAITLSMAPPSDAFIFRYDECRLETYLNEPRVKYLDVILMSAPTARLAQTPWTDRLWPRYLDGINHRWRSPDEPSPAEKYAAAFGHDVDQFTARISSVSGVDSANNASACSRHADCPRGFACGRRAGASTGFCHDRSAGLQDAWALAAVELEEPRCAVTRNGVTFHVPDIKALVSQLYHNRDVVERPRHEFTQRELARFGIDNHMGCGPDVVLGPIIGDRNGSCKDVNPALFLTGLATAFAKVETPLLVRFSNTPHYYPLLAYRVRAAQIFSANDAQRLFPGYLANLSPYPSAVVDLELDYVLNSVHDSQEDDRDAVMTSSFSFLTRLHLVRDMIDGAWLGASKDFHPVSFEIVLPTSDPEGDLLGLQSREVLALLDASLDCEAPAPVPAPAVSRVCNRVPYDAALRRVSRHVERCEAAAAFQFAMPRALSTAQLVVMCRNEDCQAVFRELRRVGFADCKLPGGFDVASELRQHVTACIRYTFSSVDPTPWAVSVAPSPAFETVPPSRSPSPVEGMETLAPMTTTKPRRPQSQTPLTRPPETRAPTAG